MLLVGGLNLGGLARLFTRPIGVVAIELVTVVGVVWLVKAAEGWFCLARLKGVLITCEEKGRPCLTGLGVRFVNVDEDRVEGAEPVEGNRERSIDWRFTVRIGEVWFGPGVGVGRGLRTVKAVGLRLGDPDGDEEEVEAGGGTTGGDGW